MNLLPTDAEIGSWTTLAQFRQWSSLKEDVWDCVNHTLGEIEQVRHMASLPASVLKHAMGAIRIPVPGAPDPRSLTAAEMLMLGLFWRACRKAVGLADIDPLTDTTPASTEATPASPTKATKRVKSAAIIDQLDETEVEPLTRSELDKAYAYHVEVTGAEPTHEAEPTAEQLAALTDKIVKRGEAPYADFSIFTPYGSRAQRQMRTRSYVFQPDGSFKATEIPGPSSFQAWTACWRVFKGVLYMIRHPGWGGQPEKMVVTAAVMEEYFDHIAKLNEEFPEAWHLIMQAEDRCRGEVFERYRRQLGNGGQASDGAGLRCLPTMGRRLRLRGSRHGILGQTCGQAGPYLSRSQHVEQKCRGHQRLRGREGSTRWGGRQRGGPTQGSEETQKRLQRQRDPSGQGVKACSRKLRRQILSQKANVRRSGGRTTSRTTTATRSASSSRRARQATVRNPAPREECTDVSTVSGRTSTTCARCMP